MEQKQNLLTTSLTAEQANALLTNSRNDKEKKRLKFASKWGPRFYAAMLSNPNIDVRENLTKEDRDHLSYMSHSMAREFWAAIHE